MIDRNPVIVLELQGGQTCSQHCRSPTCQDSSYIFNAFLCADDLLIPTRVKKFSLQRLKLVSFVWMVKTLGSEFVHRRSVRQANIGKGYLRLTSRMRELLLPWQPFCMRVCVCVCVCVHTSRTVRRMNPPRSRSSLITDEEKLQTKRRMFLPEYCYLGGFFVVFFQPFLPHKSTAFLEL